MHNVHENHTHTHGPDCGHTALAVNGQTVYLHDGHLHQPHGDHVDEVSLPVSESNPADCQPHDCSSHPAEHAHGPDCGHEAVPHGDHVDYLVDGHLHHPHSSHCDNHGPVSALS